MNTKKYIAFAAASALLVPITVPAPVQAAIFTDTGGSSHEDAIHTLVEMGIINGYPDGSFRPNGTVTRSDVVKMMGKWLISLGFQVPPDYKTNPRFKDLSPSSNDELLQYAALMKVHGIFTGTSEGKLHAKEDITREDMAIALVRAYNVIHNTDFTSYIHEQTYTKHVTDRDQAKAEARPFIDVLDYFDITNPSVPHFEPKNTTTRGQFASFIVRSAKVAEEKIPMIQVKPFAGNGYFDLADGNAANASFREPSGIVVLSDGSILITDKRNQVIRKINNGEVSTFAGMTVELNELGLPQGGFYDSDKGTAFFNDPVGIAVDTKENLFIVDSMNNAIRKISTDGKVTTVAGNGLIGNEDGMGENARFYSPQSIAVDKEGTIYVADTLNHVIRKITVNGEVKTLNAPSERVVEVVPGEVVWSGDFQDGPLKEAKFNEPAGLAIDAKGNLYVSDSGNQLIRYIDFSTYTVSTVAGNFDAPDNSSLYATGKLEDGSAENAAFNFPKGVAYSEKHGLLIADSVNRSIRQFKDGKVRTIANGFKNPVDVAVGQDGTVYVVDSHDNQIYQIFIEEGLKE